MGLKQQNRCIFKSWSVKDKTMHITFKIVSESPLLYLPSFTQLYRRHSESKALPWNNGSPTSGCIRVTWKTCLNTDGWVLGPDSFILLVGEWAPRICICNKFPGDCCWSRDHTLKTTSLDKEQPAKGRQKVQEFAIVIDRTPPPRCVALGELSSLVQGN